MSFQSLPFRAAICCSSHVIGCLRTSLTRRRGLTLAYVSDAAGLISQLYSYEPTIILSIYASSQSNNMEKSIKTTDEMHAQKFCIEAARCFLMYGGPAHHLEAQLEKLAQVLHTRAEFLLLPNTVFASFYDLKGGSDAAGGLHAIKKVGVLSVSHLRRTYSVYKRVVDTETSPEIGWQELLDIQKSELPYSPNIRLVIAYGCGAVITCLAFKGSYADAAIAGMAQLILASISIKMVDESAVIARIFE